jgi:hypothetical protein
MDVIPTAVHLTTYSGGAEDFMLMPLEKLSEQIAAGVLHVDLQQESLERGDAQGCPGGARLSRLGRN